jgi:hypothetical protein
MNTVAVIPATAERTAVHSIKVTILLPAAFTLMTEPYIKIEQS